MALLTRVIGECATLTIFSGCDEIPDEALDVLIATVMHQAVGQQCTADGLHVALPERTFEAAMRENLSPAAPAIQHRGEERERERRGEEEREGERGREREREGEERRGEERREQGGKRLKSGKIWRIAHGLHYSRTEESHWRHCKSKYSSLSWFHIWLCCDK